LTAAAAAETTRFGSVFLFLTFYDSQTAESTKSTITNTGRDAVFTGAIASLPSMPLVPLLTQMLLPLRLLPLLLKPMPLSILVRSRRFGEIEGA
jgi:hypothetical protein